jgi:hypothetical protein
VCECWHTAVIPSTGEAGGLEILAARVSEILSQKQKTQNKMGGGVIECLPNIIKDLGSIPSNEKKRKNNF